ncbi:hypothetical protein [Solimonas sp. SE-A11]|uniref:hypothetical protein n=1 Tax=Solimonas sp. SE-A11 TaxID=3054954 RepID=UPI00259CAD20|nr:hypothetical protein [Solimonas sp. SE-A11]MDM4772012.1 hypothetical protein [Solimonas sp. SE-A11]
MPRSPLLASLLLAAALSACSRSEAPDTATPGPSPEEPAPRVMRCPPAPGAQDVAARPDGSCGAAGARS